MRFIACAFLGVLAFPASADEVLWNKLATQGDLVVFMRHTQPAGGNPQHWDESGNCKGESMLTDGGRAHARRIGEAFAAHGIRPTVVSSPMCRCRDAARIAFGDTVLTEASLREIASGDSDQAARFERAALSLMTARRGKVPVVFLSHRPNIDRLTLELIDEGDLLVGRLKTGGDIDVLGRIRVP